MSTLFQTIWLLYLCCVNICLIDYSWNIIFVARDGGSVIVNCVGQIKRMCTSRDKTMDNR